MIKKIPKYAGQYIDCIMIWKVFNTLSWQISKVREFLITERSNSFIDRNKG